MKNAFFTVALVAAAGLAAISCNKQLQTSDASVDFAAPATGEFHMSLGVGTMGTKLSSSALETENKISSVKYYIFETETNRIESLLESTDGAGLASINLKAGEKKIWVVVNSPTTISAGNLEDFESTCLALSENNPSNFVMTGCRTVDIQSDTTYTIEVQRTVCKVLVGRITTAFTAPAYTKGRFKIKTIYLQNVPSSVCVDGSLELDEYVNPENFDAEYGGILGEEDIDITMYGNTSCPLNYIYFSNPNDNSDVGTNLMIYAQINGNDCYYRMNLPALERNKIYTVNQITITRPGTTDPTEDIVLGACTLNLTVKDWVTGETVTYTI